MIFKESIIFLKSSIIINSF